MPYLGALSPAGGGPTGTSGGNSAYRLASVWSAFAVDPNLADLLAATNGPVLLVDDLADSRWTLTVAARDCCGAPAPPPCSRSCSRCAGSGDRGGAAYFAARCFAIS